MGLADALSLGAVVAAVPALGGAGDALSAQDSGTAQVELVQGDGVGVLTSGLPPGLEALVGLLAGQAVRAGDVAGFEALGPRDPSGREEGLLTGEELHLADGGGAAARDATEGDRPAPAAVAAQGAVEQVGDEALGVGRGSHVLADGDGVGDLLQRVAGQLDGRRGCEGLVLGGLGLLTGGRQGAGARPGGRRRRGRGRTRCQGRVLQGRRGGARPGGGARWRTRVGPGCGLAWGVGVRVDRVGHSASVGEAPETAPARAGWPGHTGPPSHTSTESSQSTQIRVDSEDFVGK